VRFRPAGCERDLGGADQDVTNHRKQWSVLSGQWSVLSDQWSVVSNIRLLRWPLVTDYGH
jgi:hypothetical protein